MKIKFYFLLAPVVLSILLNVAAVKAESDAPKQVLITLSDDYPPISFGGLDKIQGISPDILKEVFKNYPKYQVKVEGYPWARAQDMVRLGQSDAMFSIPTDLRNKYSVASKNPGFVQNFKAFTYLGHSKLNDFKGYKFIKDFKSFTVCEYYSSGWAKDHLVGVIDKINYSVSMSTKLKMLVAKRCDVLFDSDIIVRSVSKNEKVQEQIVEIPTVFEKTEFHLQVSRLSKKPEILDIFDQEILKMRVDGRLGRILKKWQGN